MKNIFAGAIMGALIPLPVWAAEPQNHEGHAGHDMSTTKNDPVTAYGSGTARIPANESGHHGWNLASGNWDVNAHGFTNLVYTDQSGPRGDDKFYLQSMFMLSGRHDTEWGRIELRSMMSLEPLMSDRGYPNLFATGETAGGQPLVDRQHPHDLFMELSARIDVNLDDGGTSAFLYGGPVGEPALGPSVFMHRASAGLNPEAPITHHWFDSTHISYGVVTSGLANPHWQIEASAFRGGEPDEDRWDIETPKLDSWSVRASWTPNRYWALQASTGRLESPEVTHPGEDEQRTTASVQYNDGNGLSALAAFSNKNALPGRSSTAWLAEINWDLDSHHSLFGRFENVRNGELFPDEDDPRHEESFRISKFQAGYAYRMKLFGPVNLALGGSVSAFAKTDSLDPVYGKNPMGYNLFAKFSLGH